MLTEQRKGHIVWVNDAKAARNLEKYGNVHFISRRLHYAVIYLDADREEETLRNIQRLPYVKKIERSLRSEIKTEYSKESQDKTRFYSM
ncbi:YlbG family protein [Paenibacillus pasadenensis]|uniref:YlbG family protein n=1 Tax=Paenibacillus pasadenensis TaxID=217090 RepID=UPI00203FFBC3|nr:YlbG family protein [Paenibacillus pasadenensis]MCM3746163.1 YlbG family protein [Paenibacillus pasadenensis]